jgi:hypothetical protein
MKQSGLLKTITFILILLGLVVFYYYIYDGTEFLISNVDGKHYKVRKMGSNRQNRVDSLANLNNKLNTIVTSLKGDNTHNGNPDVQRLIGNWNKGVSIKEIGNLETDAAYVINKQYMSFCLKNTEGNMNLLTYVGIHELSHIMSNEIGHGQEFIKNFEFLLNYAKTLNYKGDQLYIPLNQIKTPDNYCGVSLANSIN